MGLGSHADLRGFFLSTLLHMRSMKFVRHVMLDPLLSRVRVEQQDISEARFEIPASAAPRLDFSWTTPLGWLLGDQGGVMSI